MLDIPLKEIGTFRKELLEYFAATQTEIIKEIDEKKTYSEELEDRIIDAAKQFKASR